MHSQSITRRSQISQIKGLKVGVVRHPCRRPGEALTAKLQVTNQAFPCKPIDAVERYPSQFFEQTTVAKISRPALQLTARFSIHLSDRHEATVTAGQFSDFVPRTGLRLLQRKYVQVTMRASTEVAVAPNF